MFQEIKSKILQHSSQYVQNELDFEKMAKYKQWIFFCDISFNQVITNVIQWKSSTVLWQWGKKYRYVDS